MKFLHGFTISHLFHHQQLPVFSILQRPIILQHPFPWAEIQGIPYANRFLGLRSVIEFSLQQVLPNFRCAIFDPGRFGG